MDWLINIMETQGPQLVAMRAEAEERLMDRRIREEQDAAYQVGVRGCRGWRTRRARNRQIQWSGDRRRRRRRQRHRHIDTQTAGKGRRVVGRERRERRVEKLGEIYKSIKVRVQGRRLGP